ncbi:SGNH/GDSL hydrolase family protein [Streptomyces sp. A144]|uniref:SGNH/GDSL hydrolase family protein n=1 Tax=Streptomyces sp. A144 TaxID=2871487 RepID=UPI001CBFD9F6|nr:SGNH/GDSL hydrolase family protein [Streptomyces sp. A144]UAX56817.1 SGNH/GDSL hydrolase family protein [Streptomyces sp. A144]
MARHQFGAGLADFVVRPQDGLWAVTPGAVVTFWSASDGGIQYTDLLDLAGSPITQVTADANGRIPQFQGPDSVTGMWADAGTVRGWIQARTSGGTGDGAYTSIQRIVASSTAPADIRAAATWVCDGIADQEEIQAALDDARDNGGGEVLLTVGDYNLTAPIRIEGTDDVDVEIGIILRGQGARATMLRAGAGLTSVIHLSKVVRVYMSDVGMTIGGTTDGITSSTTNGALSGHRSFWNSEFRNIQINGPWSGEHSGWAINMGSPFRSVLENVEIGGIGNGIRLFSEHSDFNPGDLTLTRCFVECVGDGMTAYEIASTTAAGVMNQMDFVRCEAIANGADCTGIRIAGVGGWGTAHTRWVGINLEQFDTLVDVEYGNGNTFRLDHVGLRTGVPGLTAFRFGANAFNNTVEHTGLLYATDDCRLFEDGNTLEPSLPNRVQDTRVYSQGAKVTSRVNPAGTTVRRQIIGNTAATTPDRELPGIYVPPGWGKHWAAARDAAAAGTGLARIVTVGGSATQGMYASNPRTKSWPGVVASELHALYGDGGSGFQQTSLSAAVLSSGDAAALAAWTAAGAIVTATGTWTQGGSKYGPGANYIYSDVPGNTLTFRARGTTVRIYTVVGSGTRPAMLYSIDGGTEVSVPQPSGTAAIQVTTVTGLSDAEHTVVLKVGAATTGQYLSVCGVSGERASGVLVHNLALAGATSATFGNPAPAALNATYQGGVDFPADLCIYTAGPNDAAANVTGDAWAANVAKWIKAVRDTGTATGDTDIVLAVPHLGRHDTVNFKYQDYAERARALADVYGCAVVNWWTLGRTSWEYWNSLGFWGTNAGTGAAGTDSVHMSDAGFQFMAEQILPLLTS